LALFYGDIAGIPLDWIVFSVIGLVGLMVAVALFVVFRGGDKGPIEEELALICTEDEHGTLQPGQLVGNCMRKEDTLLVTIPDWLDDEAEGPYTAELDIQRKVPFPFFDISKSLKRLWIILDAGDLTVVSFTTFLHGLPKRWDPPYADRRKAGKFLVGRYGGGTLTNMLTSKLGLAIIFGILMSGTLFGFFLTVASGHFH
jgi:hypothetical protein